MVYSVKIVSIEVMIFFVFNVEVVMLMGRILLIV